MCTLIYLYLIFYFQGPITNAIIIPTPSGFMRDDGPKSLLLPVQAFKRHLISETNESESGSAFEVGSVMVRITTDLHTSSYSQPSINGIASTFTPTVIKTHFFSFPFCPVI